MSKMLFWFFLLFLSFSFSSCINLPELDFGRKPFTECILELGGHDKIAILTVNGTISEKSSKSLLGSSPSLVESFITQLRLAEADPNIKTVVIKVNSPGGGVTASDILYHELMMFKKRTQKPIVVCMMSLAASGGYYISLPANWIVAHPSTLTGSVGVIFVAPEMSELMDKIGVTVNVYKSGRNKDMGSFLREPTKEDQDLMQSLVMESAHQFYDLVKKHRKLTSESLDIVKTARVFSAQNAMNLGLIDQVGYVEDAIGKASSLAGISNPTVVTYRCHQYQNDNIYNDRGVNHDFAVPKMVDLGVINNWLDLTPGFYYLWLPESMQ